MEGFSISEMYTLELRWKEAVYEQDGFCRFKGAYFTGPALSNALQIASNDNIMLDFFKQYPILVKGAYVAKFSWGEVIYDGSGTVTMKDATLSHGKLDKVPTLKGTDIIVIDTQNHEESMHIFNLTYTSYIVGGDHNMYNFMKRG